MSDKRREFTDQRYIFFVTFSVYRRRRLLDAYQPKRIVLGVLNHLLEAMAARCVGFVIMPDHMHGLVWLPVPDDLSSTSANFCALGGGSEGLEYGGSKAGRKFRKEYARTSGF